jgi:hypothetical protein
MVGCEIVDENRRDCGGAKFFRDVAFRYKRNTEFGFHQALLRRQTVDRRPIDVTEAVAQEQRGDVRCSNLAPPGYFRESDPALFAQVGKAADTAAGQRVVRRAHHPKRLSEKQFAVKVA